MCCLADHTWKAHFLCKNPKLCPLLTSLVAFGMSVVFAFVWEGGRGVKHLALLAVVLVCMHRRSVAQPELPLVLYVV